MCWSGTGWSRSSPKVTLQWCLCSHVQTRVLPTLVGSGRAWPPLSFFDHLSAFLTTSQLFWPPLSYYHHLQYIGRSQFSTNKYQGDRFLTTTQSDLGRSLQTLQNWIMQACTVEVPDIGLPRCISALFLRPSERLMISIINELLATLLLSTASYKQCS